MSITVIIQCARDKDGAYLRSSTGDNVGFVAQPHLAPPRPGWTFVRPDDPAAPGNTWRTMLSAYNACFVRSGDNPDKLRPAWELYTNPAYRGLAQKFGPDNLYILSAGWGLVRARYLLPNYNITFSNQADPVYRRRNGDLFIDARQVPNDVDGPVLFLGGLSYLPFFCDLTSDVRTQRIVYHKSKKRPDAPGCRLVRYETNARINWHYKCAHDLISDRMIAY